MFSWQGWSAARLSFAVLLGVLGNPALAQAASPVGTWDCILSGHRAGTAYLTFINAGESTSRGTFSGIEVLVPNNPKPTDVGDARNGGGGDGDTRGGTTTPPPTPGQQIFGYNGPNGPWALDNQGRTIGQFIEVSQLEDCVTNAFPVSTNNIPPISGDFCVPSTNTSITTTTNSVPISANIDGCITTPIGTNIDGTIFTNQTICTTIEVVCYTNMVNCSAITNAISFVGRVVPGRRLTLICTTPFGRTVYQGVPAKVLPDISGDWYGTKTQARIAYQELPITLSPTSDPSLLQFPNVYDVVGAGPGYSYHGNAVLSSRSRISFVFGMDPPLPTDPVTVVRAVTGPFNARRIIALTRGYDQPGGIFTNPVSFKATRFAQ